MMPNSPLDQLADIHLPATASVWPLAPIWWILIAAILILIVSAFALYRRKQRNAYRWVAASLLDTLHHEATSEQPSLFLQRTNRLLRETALTAYGRQFPHSLKGRDWLQWLDSTVKKAPFSFSHDLDEALSSALYQPSPQVDIEKVYALSRFWILNHINSNALAKQKSSLPPKEPAHV